MTISEMEKDGYTGTDASLEISLFEYGLAWKRDGEDFRFIYGKLSDESGNYYHFDWARINASCDPAKEFDWVDWKAVSDFAGKNTAELLCINSEELPFLIYDLLSYYGHENVFGSSYSGFEIENK
jgi:hypothetical protein